MLLAPIRTPRLLGLYTCWRGSSVRDVLARLSLLAADAFPRLEYSSTSNIPRPRTECEPNTNAALRLTNTILAFFVTMADQLPYRTRGDEPASGREGDEPDDDEEEIDETVSLLDYGAQDHELDFDLLMYGVSHVWKTDTLLIRATKPPKTLFCSPLMSVIRCYSAHQKCRTRSVRKLELEIARLLLRSSVHINSCSKELSQTRRI